MSNLGSKLNFTPFLEELTELKNSLPESKKPGSVGAIAADVIKILRVCINKEKNTWSDFNLGWQGKNLASVTKPLEEIKQLDSEDFNFAKKLKTFLEINKMPALPDWVKAIVDIPHILEKRAKTLEQLTNNNQQKPKQFAKKKFLLEKYKKMISLFKHEIEERHKKYHAIRKAIQQLLKNQKLNPVHINELKFQLQELEKQLIKDVDNLKNIKLAMQDCSNKIPAENHEQLQQVRDLISEVDNLGFRAKNLINNHVHVQNLRDNFDKALKDFVVNLDNYIAGSKGTFDRFINYIAGNENLRKEIIECLQILVKDLKDIDSQPKNMGILHNNKLMFGLKAKLAQAKLGRFNDMKLNDLLTAFNTQLQEHHPFMIPG